MYYLEIAIAWLYIIVATVTSVSTAHILYQV